MFRGLLLAGLCLVHASAPVASATAAAPQRMTDAQIVEDLSAFMERLAAADAFSGTVLLAKGDKVLFEHAYGFANHAFNARNTLETKLGFASMGKMFTAVAILQLAQQGKLSVDDTMLKLLPDYPNKEVAGRITVHQLLTHTSGLGDFFGPAFHGSSPTKYRTPAAYLPLFADKPLDFEPGTKWRYSNAGYIVLGLIVEQLCGQSYYDYVRERIFVPAGMLNTDNYNVDDDVPNLALGYTIRGDDLRPREGARRRSNILLRGARGSSAGGGYSTVEDLFRFARALQGHRLLNAKYTGLQLTGKVQMQRGNSKYAYGMIETESDGVRIVGHSGGFPGVNSQLEMYPERGYTVVVMSNYDEAAQPVIRRLRYVLAGKRIPVEVQLPAAALGAFVGQYDAPAGGMPRVEVMAGEGGLSLKLHGAVRRFLPLSAQEFFDEDDPRQRLSFQKDEQGRIVALTIAGASSNPIHAARRP